MHCNRAESGAIAGCFILMSIALPTALTRILWQREVKGGEVKGGHPHFFELGRLRSPATPHRPLGRGGSGSLVRRG